MSAGINVSLPQWVITAFNPAALSARSVGLAGGLALVASIIYFLFFRKYFSPFYNLPCPESRHWFWGNEYEVLNQSVDGEETGRVAMQLKWGAAYGTTFRTHTLLGSLSCYTYDFKAIPYIWGHPDRFIKPKGPNLILADILGQGLVTVEGPAHRRQRRVLNPAFGWLQVQGMTPMVLDKALSLGRRIQRILQDSPTPGVRELNMHQQVSDCSLDIIGAAGFDKDLGAIAETPTDLRVAYNEGNAIVGAGMTPLTKLHISMPVTRKFTPNPRKKVVAASRQYAGLLVNERKRELAAQGTKVEKATPGKDVLSLLLKANMAPDLREDQRLDDLEVIDQIATVLFAGHETTSTAMTWCLLLLSTHPEYQDRLREECQGVYEDDPDFLITELKVRKGDVFFTRKYHTPLAYINRLPSVWGSDASEFNPDRFDRDGKRPNVPGVWGNLATFLGGPHNCIGHRLTIVEMKAMLFVLMRGFVFEPAPSNPTFDRSCLLVQRPLVRGQEDKGPQLPLLVRAV